MEDKVNLTVAEIFYDQCCGSSNGHMAAIPNSPIIDSITRSAGVKTKKDFAEFLRAAADWLDGGGKI